VQWHDTHTPMPCNQHEWLWPLLPIDASSNAGTVTHNGDKKSPLAPTRTRTHKLHVDACVHSGVRVLPTTSPCSPHEPERGDDPVLFESRAQGSLRVDALQK
jgi:hypothetical protein